MIGFLRGHVVHKKEEQIIIDVNGVGYNVYVSGRTLEQLPPMTAEVTLYTYLQVREDAMTLYGFLRMEDIDMFKLLISVNGIGPKAALSIFQVFTTNDLKFAILAGDAKAIAKSPGVGPKTAQRLIMELKDKIAMEDAFEERFSDHDSPSADSQSAAMADAIEGLISLGYSSTEAYKAIHSVENADTMTADQLLKTALKHLI